MTRILFASVSLVMLLLVGTAAAGMQHRMGEQMPMGSQAEPQESAAGQHHMRGQGTGGMQCPMMAMLLDPAAMALIRDGQSNPKVVGRLMQLRGDMLKAMGDVLLKYGKAMEGDQ
jgi:hypothetical protein